MKKITLLLIILFSNVSNATIRYVTSTGGLVTQDGTSWATAFPGNLLQSTINASGVGDEVWVAQGTYLTTATTNRTISFNMKNGVAIYGSFAGSETLLSQRIISNGLLSILSAEIGIAGINDNSYHTISNFGLDNSAIIDGFIISGANDNRIATTTDGLGGGIYNNGSGAGNFCNPTIRNCVLINNQAVFGGGIFNNGYNGGVSTPIISNCVIAYNNATSGGGAIDNFGVLGNASPTITNCVIYENTASQRAGGMYCWGGNNGNANPIVLNTVFANNRAFDGGALISDRTNTTSGSSGNSNPSFKNCVFWGNTTTGGLGPQFYILGSATVNTTYTAIDLTSQNAPHVLTGATTGNTNSNPSFANIALGFGNDGKWLTTDDGLQLNSISSPCYNTGSNSGVSSTDILNLNRILGAVVDMGAYEFDVTLSNRAFINDDSFVVYPNPTKDKIHFSGLKQVFEKVLIINYLGNQIKENGFTNELDVSDLQNGIYFLVLKSGNNIMTQKFIKQ
ncbi:T9SS type A sorting domain-containing protein [Flavobacterium sp.]|uniref:T9SS type A sorting domain-containing protein n=1 Tax=Flavobacterium sp. TaxID=239 RepID=UPI00374D6712